MFLAPLPRYIDFKMPRRTFKRTRTKPEPTDITLIPLSDVKKYNNEIRNAILKVSESDDKISKYEEEIRKHKQEIKDIEYRQKKIINERKKNIKHVQDMISKPPVFKHTYNLRSNATNT